MIKCKRCGGNCDSGDIVDGVCVECLEEERQEMIRAETVVRMMCSPCEQMKLNLNLEVTK